MSEEKDVPYNQSKRAQVVLDSVLGDSQRRAAAAAQPERVDVQKERQGRPVLDRDTGRTRSRVLFVTTNKDVLVENGVEERHYAALGAEFDEIHVMVFMTNELPNMEPRRRGSNLWVYPVHVDAYWHMAFVAAREAKERVTFNGSIRPDIIVGVDPLIAGVAAYRIAQAFNRPWQLHVTKNVFSTKTGGTQYSWRDRRIAKYVLARAKSIRTNTDHLKQLLERRCSKDTSIQVLPQFYNFSGYRDAVPSYDLHERYSQYSFIILAFGELTADSPLHDVFAASHQLLHNPSIGLIVVGDGPAHKLFQRKAELLNISSSVVFLKEADDLYALLKTADVLMEVSNSEASEERVLRAASAGIPLILRETDLRNELFADGESAFLCPSEDTICLRQKLNKFLNTAALRTRFSDAGRHIAESRLEEDPATYYRAYRDSIEAVLS